MPFVNVKITKGATAEQKAKIIAQITQTLVDVLDKNPQTTHIVIDEVELENWGYSGKPTSELRKQ